MTARYTPRHTRVHDWAAIRLVVVAVLFALAGLVLWARAFQVQVLMGAELAARAERQHLAAESVSGPRGRIFDRQGRVLAKSVRCASVYARPLEVRDPAHTARELGRALGLGARELQARLGARRPFVWIARQVSDREAAAVAALALPGVGTVEEFKRLYPSGHLAGQLLGFAGLDGAGLEGLEKSLEDTLAGRSDRTVVQRDASGRRLLDGDEPSRASVRGGDVRLTIDADIQAMAEQAVAGAVTTYHAKSGMGLVVHVPTGDILAWAVFPFFNPNIYSSYGPETWRNRIALDALEPGSTFKPFVVAAALQEGVVRPDSVYFCENGRFEMPGAVIRDTHDYADLPVTHILRYSSNIGMAKIGLEMGARTMHGYLDRLGFGRRTGLPLAGEARGILRDPGAWQRVDLANVAFGQGVAVTALQMARAYLCLARGGVAGALRLVVADPPAPREERRVFSAEVAGQVLAMMRDVVQADGTGTRARIEGLTVAGKTGTAQKASASGGYGNDHVGSFVALLPGESPEFLVMVIVDEPAPQHYGGVVAAPAVREIALQSLAYMGRLPEPSAQAGTGTADGGLTDEDVRRLVDAIGAGIENPAVALQGSEAVPDVVGMSLRRAVELLAGGGAVPEVRGSGLVVRRQSPAPGKPWPGTGDRCVLWLDGAPDRS